MWVRAIVCIMLSWVKKLCYCCVVATSERKMRTSTVLANIGKIGKEGQRMKDRTHDEAMAEIYREDPAYALQLLNSILEDGDQSELLIALRQMTKAFGGVQAVASACTQVAATRQRARFSCNGS